LSGYCQYGCPRGRYRDIFDEKFCFRGLFFAWREGGALESRFADAGARHAGRRRCDQLGYDGVGNFIGLFRKTPGIMPVRLAVSFVRKSQASILAALLAMAPRKDSFA